MRWIAINNKLCFFIALLAEFGSQPQIKPRQWLSETTAE